MSKSVNGVSEAESEAGEAGVAKQKRNEASVVKLVWNAAKQASKRANEWSERLNGLVKMRLSINGNTSSQ